MAILPSRRLGPYEIQSAIGAGGMGEIYRAKDTRLERIVAIKVLADLLRFLVLRSCDPAHAAPPMQIKVVLNWLEELKRRAPAGRK